MEHENKSEANSSAYNSLHIVFLTVSDLSVEFADGILKGNNILAKILPDFLISHLVVSR
jgi:hypothetical protein